MSSDRRDFDKTAAIWDEAPRRVQLATDVAAAIKQTIALTPKMDVLDFGCGTGLLTLALQPYVRSVTGLDTSRGMLEVLQAKVAERKLANVRLHVQDPDRPLELTGRFDLIVSSMTFHHVPAILPLLKQLYAVTATGGCLCVADLDSDGGRFHDDPTGVFHQGFDRDEIRRTLRAAGYAEAGVATATEVEKPDGHGGTARFTIFLATGRKG